MGLFLGFKDADDVLMDEWARIAISYQIHGDWDSSLDSIAFLP